jgi:[ribosomal protein S5]-alanine N-acetyltransferase
MILNISLFPTLTTRRLVLRRLSEQDSQDIFALRSNDEVNRFIKRPKPADLHEAIEFIQKINKGIEEKRSLYWVISIGDSQEFAGTICLWNFTDGYTIAELGYELFPAFQGKGFMQEALEAVLHFAFGKIFLKQVEAFTNKNNLRSINLLSRIGFKPEPDRKDEDQLSNIVFSMSEVEFRKN